MPKIAHDNIEADNTKRGGVDLKIRAFPSPASPPCANRCIARGGQPANPWKVLASNPQYDVVQQGKYVAQEILQKSKNV